MTLMVPRSPGLTIMTPTAASDVVMVNGKEPLVVRSVFTGELEASVFVLNVSSKRIGIHFNG